MNFEQFVDYKALPFKTYLDTLIDMSPISIDDGKASFYLDKRDFKCIGHFDEIYPEHCSEHNYERFLVLENGEGERLLMFDAGFLNATIEIICDPRDQKALSDFFEEYRDAGIRQEQELKDYQDRCAKQMAGLATADDPKEYDVFFTIEGRARITATSADEAGDILNQRVLRHNYAIGEMINSSILSGNAATNVVDIFKPERKTS